MILLMIGDIKVFLTLMLIFMTTQGVLINSFTNPNSEYENIVNMVFNVLFMPYYQIYGELFLEDITNEKTEVYTG